MDGDVAVESE